MKLNIPKENFEKLSDENKELLRANFSFHADTMCWHSKEGISTEDAFEISKAIDVYPNITWSPSKERYNKLTNEQKENIRTLMKYDPKTATWESKVNCGDKASYVLRSFGEEPSLDVESSLKTKLLRGVESLKTSEQYRSYLISMSKFTTYSPQNQILIAMQCPDATVVASRNKWWKEFERSVNPSAKGMTILAPNIKKIPKPTPEEKELIKEGKLALKDVKEFTENLIGFRPLTIYDISETSGKPLPEIPMKRLVDAVDDFDDIKEAIIKSAKPYEYEFVDRNEMGTSNGICSYLDKKIKIRKDLSPAHTIKTMLHEYAHSILHEKDALSDEPKTSRKVRELQAESSAFILSQKLGIDSSDYSFGYIASWSEKADNNAILESLEASATAARTMSRRVEYHLKQLQEQKLDVASESKFKAQGYILIPPDADIPDVLKDNPRGPVMQM